MLKQVPPIRLPNSAPWAHTHHTRNARSTSSLGAKSKGATLEEGDPPEGRIVETELRHEAERSYMAVRLLMSCMKGFASTYSTRHTL